MKTLYARLGAALLAASAGIARAETILGRAETVNPVIQPAPASVTSGLAGPGDDLAEATFTDNLASPGRTNIDLEFLPLAAGTYDVTDFLFFAQNNSGTVQPFLTERIANGQHRVLWIGAASAPVVGVNRVVPALGTASRFVLGSSRNVYAGFVMTQNAVGFADPGSAFDTDHHGTPLALTTNGTFTVSNANLPRNYAFGIRVQSTAPGRVQPASIGFTAGGSAGPVTVASRPNNGTHFLKRIQIGASFAGDIPVDPATTFAFGSPIVPLPAVGADLTKSPTISTNTAGRAFYSPQLDQVFGTNPGFVTVTWKNAANVDLPPIRYLVTSTPSQLPVAKRIYHTHSAGLNLATQAADQNSPAVSVASVAQTVFHWNTAIPDNGADPFLRRHGDNLLRAKDRQGLIVIEHRNGSGNTLVNGVQVVEVLPPQPDPGVQTVPMGAILAATFTNTVDGAAFVASGQLYVNNKVGDPFRHMMVVTQSQTDNTPVDVYWRQTDGLGIHWPFEFRRYAVSGLDPAASQVAIYHTEGTLAPTVALPAAGTFLNIHYNSRIQSNELFKAAGNVLRATGDTGEVVVIYHNGADATGNYVNREIVQLRNYVPDVAAGTREIGDELLPFLQHAQHRTNQTFVARGLQSSKVDAANFIWQHPLADTGAHAGRIFGVKPTTASPPNPETEVFWRRQGLFAIWPYEMRRYNLDWPTSGQRFVRRATGESLPKVRVPAALNAALWPARTVPDAVLSAGTEFHTTGAGWTLLGFESGPPAARTYVGFEPILSTLRTDPVYAAPATNWVIGVEITDPGHAGTHSGIVYEPTGTRYEPAIYQPKDALGWTTGQIFAVNTGLIEVFWSNLHQPNPADAVNRIQWPSTTRTYNNLWPSNPPRAIIASELGTGVITNEAAYLYFQNDSTQPGYNPNDEHALDEVVSGGIRIYPLRNDLGSAGTSLPHLVVPHRMSDAPNAPFGVRVWQVLAEGDGHTFSYAGVVPNQIKPPAPLSSALPPAPPGSSVVSGPVFTDRKGDFHAFAAGNNGVGTSTVVMRFFYKVRDGFAFLGAPNTWPTVGSNIPWLDGYAQSSGQGTPAGTPKNITYTISWPPNVPELRVGETAALAKAGLPNLLDQTSVQIVYQQATALNPAQGSVKLIDPIRTREASLTLDPNSLGVEVDIGTGGNFFFPDAPPHLRNRLFLDPLAQKLKFKGQFVATNGINEAQGFLLLNVLSARDAAALKAIPGGVPAFHSAIDAIAAQPLIEVAPTDTNVEKFALTAGHATGPGFVTLAFNNNATLSGEASAVMLGLIKVSCPLYVGDLVVIPSDNPFDEQLTLRHTGDFAARADQYEFEWRILNATQNPNTTPKDNWEPLLLPPDVNATGALDFTIKGSGIRTLIDNFLVCRWRPKTQPFCTGNPNPNTWWSDWTPPQLAEGWIKRALRGASLYDQNVANGPPSTIASMLSLAGTRWIGDSPLNQDSVNSFGAITVFETILKRGLGLSLEGTPPVSGNADVNNALLLAAGRLADLYMLLGNEAYADASDPTIAQANQTSMHAFMNQTSNLLEEELALLRGRDDSLLPDVRFHPTYNRLIWNFTLGDGEVAYAGNYGTFSQPDAQQKYPQGHGDAWGHYLTAIKNYYRLLRNANYSHQARSEFVSVAGTPVAVDFTDERKFARAAAARARTGAEIVNLTYREKYTENPSGQRQGYEDTNPDRAWGLGEWASRAGQGAYLDWVVGNSLLPEKDTDPTHTGIQIIDRTTVADLREVEANFQDIQRQMDQADAGLNPLGLAKNVVPFDISPDQLALGKTHFEQIFDRAVDALQNAIAVFNYANGSSMSLRQQQDSLVDFSRNANDREIDFRNRLIEIFGSPFIEDIGPGKTYPTDYVGPDLYHFNYIDEESLTGVPNPRATDLTVTFTNQVVNANGGMGLESKTVTFRMAENRFRLVKPANFTVRQSPGEIQRALSELLQTRLNFQRALNDYNAQFARIRARVDLLEAQRRVDQTEVNLENLKTSELTNLNKEILALHEKQIGFSRGAAAASAIADAVAEALPKSVGFSVDATSIARGAIKLTGAGVSFGLGIASDLASVQQMSFQHQKDLALFGSNVAVITNQQSMALLEDLETIRDLMRDMSNRQLELFSMNEAMQQAGDAYLAVLARGLRLQDDLLRFRKETAADVREFRFKDMAFRVFRNDALQKYRAQFDLAARYVYLAAKAYDFETNLQPHHAAQPRTILTNIIRARSLGSFSNGLPTTGGLGDPGLADPMARMNSNFAVLKTQLGFNNPQTEDRDFSLKRQFFRSSNNATGTAAFRESLRRLINPNVLTLPEFKRFCTPFSTTLPREPAIVIPFSSAVFSDQNFFGFSNAPGDTSFNDTQNAIKIRSFGLNFASYPNTLLAGSPVAYLVPVGADVLRSPGLARATREWKILDQALPVPFPNVSDVESAVSAANYTPVFGSMSGNFVAVRTFPSISASFTGPITQSTILVGRSVWNTRWALIIPAANMATAAGVAGRDAALETFISNITDITLQIKAYAYTGNPP
jgi:hypothetical protein